MNFMRGMLIVSIAVISTAANAQNCTSSVVGNQIYTSCSQPQQLLPAPNYARPPAPAAPAIDTNTIIQLGILKKQQELLQQQQQMQQQSGQPLIKNSGLIFPKHIKDFGLPEPENIMRTCLEQYIANKTSNKNGGHIWIQQGGGYYSMCNAHFTARR